MSKFSKIAAAAVLSVGSAAAMAETVELTGMSYTPFGGAYFLDGVQKGGDASELHLTTSTGNTFAAYCIDLMQELSSPPGLYDVSPVPPLSANLSLGQVNAIGKLFTAAGFVGDDYLNDDVTTARQGAALQLAIWDVVYDGSLTLGGLSTGRFTATFSGATVAAFDSLVTAAFGPEVVATNLSFYTSVPNGRSQNLVSSIPEPSTYALVAACLGVIGLVAKRKQTA